jgi:hypothetical protein
MTGGATRKGPLRHHIYVGYNEIEPDKFYDVMEIGVLLQFEIPGNTYGRISEENGKYYLLRAINGFYQPPKNFQALVRKHLSDDITIIDNREWIKICSISDFNCESFLRVISIIAKYRYNLDIPGIDNPETSNNISDSDNPETSNNISDSDNPETSNNISDSDIDLLEISDEEGRKKLVMHLHRERSARLVAAKRKNVLDESGELACEVCDFTFESKYGERGEDYCEVHHRQQLADNGIQETRLVDLAILCSNCHRIIHRRAPMLSVEELRKKVSEVTSEIGQ